MNSSTMTSGSGASLVIVHLHVYKTVQVHTVQRLNYYLGQVSKRRQCFVEIPDENPSIVHRLAANGDEWLCHKTM